VLGLVQDVKTRWTAAYHMMERMVLMYDLYIHRVLINYFFVKYKHASLQKPDVMAKLKKWIADYDTATAV